jgi:hypothetical protein
MRRRRSWVILPAPSLCPRHYPASFIGGFSRRREAGSANLFCRSAAFRGYRFLLLSFTNAPARSTFPDYADVAAAEGQSQCGLMIDHVHLPTEENARIWSEKAADLQNRSALHLLNSARHTRNHPGAQRATPPESGGEFRRTAK